MNEDQKQPYIEAAHKWIEVMHRYIENHPQDISAPITLGLYQIALTSLTVQPVKLPDVYGYEHPEKEEPFYTLKKDEVIAAIRAAGYEVQE